MDITERLIFAVSNLPELYDMSSKEYHNMEKKKKKKGAWESFCGNSC